MTCCGSSACGLFYYYLLLFAAGCVSRSCNCFVLLRRVGVDPINRYYHVFQRDTTIIWQLEESNRIQDESTSFVFPSSTSSLQNIKAVVLDMLYRMTLYMADMVDTTTCTTPPTSSDVSTHTSSTSTDSNDGSPTMYPRFYAASHVVRGTKWHGHCPLRDLGVAWDVTTLLQFWNDQHPKKSCHGPCTATLSILHRAVQGTLQAYLVELEEVPNGAIPQDAQPLVSLVLNSHFLREPSNIAHSGLLLLVALGAALINERQYNNNPDSRLLETSSTMVVVHALTRGILSQQQASNGAWRIRFPSTASTRNEDDDDHSDNSNIYQGIEFYPGEAMVALMQVLLLKQQPHSDDDCLDPPHTTALSVRIVSAMRRAFHFYSNHYQQNKSTLDTNYHIWQVQALAQYFHFLLNQKQQQQRIDNPSFPQEDNNVSLVADYVLELCRGIMESQSWKELMRGRSFFPNLQTVEIACGLDALMAGLDVALAVPPQPRLDQPSLSQQQQLQRWWSHIERAVEYLQFVQQQVSPDAVVGQGGLGYGGLQTLEQRLDVTGHAVSALIKVYDFTERHGLSTDREAG